MHMRFVLAALAAAFAVWNAGWLAAPAVAQDADLRALTDELTRLRNDLTDIQRFVYRGDAPAPSAGGAALPPADSEFAASAARAEVRFGELEDEIRALTGQIEEIAHRIDQVSGRVDKLIGDVDFRLMAIERAQAEAASRKAQAGESQAAAVAPTQQAPAEPPPAEQPGTLGTVSLGALSPEEAAGAVPVSPAPPTTPALPPGTTKQQYDYAFSLLRQQEYAEAERALTAFIAAHPGDQLAGNAHYWLAETFYVRGDYRKAAGYFATGYKNFPESNKASDNLLKLGMSLANLDEKDKACFTFKELAERFPDASPSIKQRAAAESQRAGCS